MPDNAFGFGPAKKKLDLSGIPTSAPEVTPEREAAAIERGEAMGFVAREPVAPAPVVQGLVTAPVAPVGLGGGKVGRQRPQRRTQTRAILIKGPEDVMDAFVAFVNEKGYSAYWQGIADLMETAKNKS